MRIQKKIRQGDLLFIPIGKLEDWRIRNLETSKSKDGIIQEGEATGHHHRLENLEDATLYRPRFGEPIIVTGDRGVNVIHGSTRTGAKEKLHGINRLKPNTTYEVHIARELDITGNTRQVVD